MSCHADEIRGPIVASVSGGKDSTAMCLWLQEQGLEFTPVFLDTGWESVRRGRLAVVRPIGRRDIGGPWRIRA